LLSSADIDRIIDLAGNAESILVLSPSENGGTNALYLRPPNLISISYGSGSFKRHLRLALSRGIPVKVYYSASIACDVDTQKDLKELIKLQHCLLSTFASKLLRKNVRKQIVTQYKFFQK
jgi:2-phospho-L-lactate guanylyltransferase (CobY/MobA/RfbA family)